MTAAEKNMYQLFETLTVERSSHDGFKCVKTRSSSWPNFVFNVKPDAACINAICTNIQSGDVPNAVIVSEHQLAANSALFEGFLPLAKWPLLQYDAVEPSVIESKLMIKEVETPEALELWSEIASEGFGRIDSSILPVQHTHQYFIGYSNAEAVACALLFHAGGVSGIYHVCTRKSHRGEGFGTEMYRHCLNIGSEMKQPIVSQATEKSAHIWQSLGMNHCGNLYLLHLPNLT